MYLPLLISISLSFLCVANQISLCSLQNHQNIGPIIVLYDNGFNRRLVETASGDHQQDVRDLTKLILSGGIDDHVRKLHEEDADFGSDVQGANPDGLKRLKVTFKSTLFEVRFVTSVSAFDSSTGSES